MSKSKQKTPPLKLRYIKNNKEAVLLREKYYALLASRGLITDNDDEYDFPDDFEDEAAIETLTSDEPLRDFLLHIVMFLDAFICDEYFYGWERLEKNLNLLHRFEDAFNDIQAFIEDGST